MNDFSADIIDRTTALENYIVQIGHKKIGIVYPENEKEIKYLLLDKYGIRFKLYPIPLSEWKEAIIILYSYNDEIKYNIEHFTYNVANILENIFHMIIQEAILQNASDIHLSIGKTFEWAFRIYGKIYRYSTYNKQFGSALLIYIKYISKIDIINTKNSDGQNVQLIINGKKYTIRFSIMNAFKSTIVTIRIFADINNLNIRNMISEEYYNFISKFLNKKQGMGIIAGSTGSGKSSTLYGLAVNIPNDKKVISIEYPIEFIADNIVQVEIDSKDIKDTMRHIVRQDPDIIILNEIRDKDTAEFACNMSVSGHLILTTIHSQSAQLIPVRLINLGITNPILLGQLDWVACQHLATLLCNKCKIKKNDQYIKTGCIFCKNTGYFGRILIEEFFTLTEEHKSLLRENDISQYIKLSDNILNNKSIQDKALKLYNDGLIDQDELSKLV